MRTTLATGVTALTVIAALAIPGRMEAHQQKKECER
jgi:hypothetical protein